MSIKPLRLFDQYSREEVYKIFDGVTPFTIGAGNWGLHRLVKIPKSEQDFVFFVTFGQKQLGHDFDESITEDGILTWQSQPKQTLNNKVIKQLISHNICLQHNKTSYFKYFVTHFINSTPNWITPSIK